MSDILYSQLRILEKARSFRKLNNIYIRNMPPGAISDQLLETAQLLEEVSGIDLEYTKPDEKRVKEIRKVLESNGIKISNITFFRRKDNKLRISIYSKTSRGHCIDAADMAYAVSRIMEKDFAVLKGSRNIITDRNEEIILEEAPVFFSLFGAELLSRKDGTISGDSYTYINNHEGMTHICLSDGVGTGIKANKTSSMIIELIEQFIEAGFSDKTAVELVNSAMASGGEENPFTVDMTSVDLCTGSCSMIKLGAAATFIKRRDKVKMIRPSSLPAGIFEKVEPDIAKISIEDGDYIINISDGVSDALPFFDKEQQLAKMISETKETNPKALAAEIMDEVLYFTGKNRKDDMAVLVTGFWK